MNRILAFIRRHLDTFVKYAMVLLTIFLISLLFPSQSYVSTDYQVGQVWTNPDLVAPFDFAVLKPEAELQAELEAVKSELDAYFGKDPARLEIALKDFEQDFRQVISNLDRNNYSDVHERADAYIDVGKSLLQKFYDQGILHTDSIIDESGTLKVVEDNIVSEQEPLTQDQVLAQLRVELQRSDLNHASLLYPVLERHLHPNVTFDQELTDKFAQTALQRISTTRGKVNQGELIVAKGNRITEEIALRLKSYQQAEQQNTEGQRSKWIVLIGYLLLTSLIVGVYLFYLQFHNRQVFNSWRKLLFMLMWLLLFGYLVYIVEGNDTLSAYMIPFCIAPIVIKTFYNDRLALFSLIVIVLIASFLSSLGYEFTFLQILAGIVTVLTNHITRYWSKFFNSILLILLTYCLGYLGLMLIREGSLNTIDWSIFIWFFINVILTLLAYPLVPLLERIFGFTSSITLSELSDVNLPLLKELSIKAPGTFQHSLQVGNLAEAAGDAIGADTLLLKVAALYHDIGKVKEPTIFIENQSGQNPHDGMTPMESAKKIIGHVTEGVNMARKNRLPKVLVDFIRTHHGTTRVEYFYQTLIQSQEEPVDEAEFRYPGPKPSTREQAILMIADSLEAASKSLKEPSESSINDLVDKIIGQKIQHKQLQYTDLSFKELEKIRASFKKVLKSIYHIRVEYPAEAETK